MIKNNEGSDTVFVATLFDADAVGAVDDVMIGTRVFRDMDRMVSVLTADGYTKEHMGGEPILFHESNADLYVLITTVTVE